MRRLPGWRGFTLIEVLIVGAVVAIIAVIAAPSLRDFILIQRLKSINAQLVTDLQYARSEAVARNTLVRINFLSSAAMTCYTIYVSPDNAIRCDCLQGQGAACTGSMQEIRTTQVPTSAGVRVVPPARTAIAFDAVTGGIWSIPTDRFGVPVDQFSVEAFVDTARKLRTDLNRTGRPTVCAPSGSTMTESRCPT
ncbi:MAG: GspH/FimT family pseudopilin [Rubrivivax sp.]|nr:GspH/FimT family pseudopilin [Rubrivivax sp.]